MQAALQRCARLALTLVVLGGSGMGWAQSAQSVAVCFNYGCVQQIEVLFAGHELEWVGRHFAEVTDAGQERAAIARAIADMYRLAGRRSPVAADRAGNVADEGVHGRMDCIDHSTTTTRFLELMAAQGWLRHHVVVNPARRTRFMLFEHFAAVIVEIARLASAQHVPENALRESVRPQLAEAYPFYDAQPAPEPAVEYAGHYAVDSWFVEHAEPAVILPLADWMKGEGPNVH